MIRLATLEDMPEMIRIGRNFSGFVPHGNDIMPDDEQLERSLTTLFDFGGVVFLAEKGGVAIGALVAILSPVWYNLDRFYATELGWWVEKEHRTGTTALRLVKAFEKWAKDSGAGYATMCNMIHANEKQIGVVYEKKGYIMVEQTFTKKL